MFDTCLQALPESNLIILLITEIAAFKVENLETLSITRFIIVQSSH